jgi:methionyl-tRNA formyltransferase
MSKPRLLFMGTPEFAVPALTGLVRSGYPVIGVVTQPDRPQGRGRLMAPPPVKCLAESLGLPVFQPEKVRDPGFLETFRSLAPDLVVVASFGQILPKELLDAPRWGCINIHPSLLPRFRGAAPIHRTIIAGEQRTGITIMRLGEGVDSGDILLQEETPLDPEESYGELHDRLAQRGAELLLIALAMQQAGTLAPRPQDHRLATLAPRLSPKEGLIHWESDCHTIVRLIRGLSPTPCAYTTLAGRKLKVFRAAAEKGSEPQKPGTVVEETPAGLHVAAGAGAVVLQEVQFEGKKRLPIGEFLRGCRLSPGELLGGKGP